MINSNNGRLPERKFHHSWPLLIIITYNDNSRIIIINKKTDKSANKIKTNKCTKQLLQKA